MKSDVAPYSSATKKSRELEATGKGRVTRNRDAPLLSFRRKRLTGSFVREDRVKGKVPSPLEKLPGRSPSGPREGIVKGRETIFF